MDAFVDNLVKLVGTHGANILNKGSYKALGQYPHYMDKFLKEYGNKSTSTSLIHYFYENNPHQKTNIALAKHLLFQITEPSPIEIIYDIFKNDINTFFEDMPTIVNWITKNPSIISLPFFDSVRSDRNFFDAVKDIPNIYLGYLKVDIPDEPDKIKVWLENDHNNYFHLPEKYRHDLDIFQLAISGVFNTELIKLFNHAHKEVQENFEVAKTFIDKGLYSYLPEHIRAKKDVFTYMMDTQIKSMEESVSPHIANSGKKIVTTTLYFLQHIPSSVLQNSHHVVKIFEFMDCARYGKDFENTYKNWLTFLKRLKKEDAFIHDKFDEIDYSSDIKNKPKWHLGLLKDVKHTNKIEYRIYFHQTLRELSEIYKIYDMTQTMQKELPITSAPIRKIKI